MKMYGAGYEPFFRAGILSKPPFKPQYQERLAEIRDLLFNPEQTGWLIDEHAAMISIQRTGCRLPMPIGPSGIYNHVLESSYVMPEKSRDRKVLTLAKPPTIFV